MFNRTVKIILPLMILGCSDQTKQEQVKQQSFILSVESEKEFLPVTDTVNCPITPNLSSEIKVPPIYKSNNLRRRIGYATYAMGQFIRIDGVITDSNCVPIGNATVQIWHADSNGFYKNPPSDGYLYDNLMYSQQSTRFNEEFNTNNADENFTGSGSTVTDNLGRFTFLTIMPGGSDPLINLRVIHKDFSELSTALYFSNDSNKVLRFIKVGENIVDGIKEVIYKQQITLLGNNRNVRY